MNKNEKLARIAAKALFRERWIAAGTPPLEQFWKRLTFVDKFKAYDLAFEMTKPEKKSYMVIGGVFTDTNFENVEPGTEEQYGPYENYSDARMEWQRRSFTPMLDNCYHRISIKEI